MSASPDELPASQARNTFSDVIGRAQHAGTTTWITSHGRRVAAVVPVEAAEALERMEDEALTAMALQARDEPGESIPHADVVAGLDR